MFERSDVVCERAFPPTSVMTIKSMITFAIESHPNVTADRDRVKSLMSPWIKAISELKGDLPASSSAGSSLQAAAGLAVFSLILTFALLTLSVLSLSLLRSRLQRWMLYILALVDAILLLAAGTLIIKAMNDGPRAVIQASGIDQGNERTYIGLGLYVLFAGVSFKLISIAVLCVVAVFGLWLVITLIMLCCACCCGGRDKDEVRIYNEYYTARD